MTIILLWWSIVPFCCDRLVFHMLRQLLAATETRTNYGRITYWITPNPRIRTFFVRDPNFRFLGCHGLFIIYRKPTARMFYCQVTSCWHALEKASPLFHSWGKSSYWLSNFIIVFRILHLVEYETKKIENTFIWDVSLIVMLQILHKYTIVRCLWSLLSKRFHFGLDNVWMHLALEMVTLSN